MTYITVLERPPCPETYCDIRVQCGLSARPLETAQKALPQSVYGVSIMQQGKVIGMGRIMGDACFWFIVDVCVLPEHQRKGVGKLIMSKLMAYVNTHAPTGCDVALLAVKDAKYLYQQYGFQPTEPMGTIAMRRFTATMTSA